MTFYTHGILQERIYKHFGRLFQGGSKAVHHDISDSGDSDTDVEPIDADLPFSGNKNNVSTHGLTLY